MSASDAVMYQCTKCKFQNANINQIAQHVAENHADTDNSNSNMEFWNGAYAISVSELNEEENRNTANTNEVINAPTTRVWSVEDTLLLISLVQDNDQAFQERTNKMVFTAIAKTITQKSKIACTQVQADTKWKALKRTYKKIKESSKTSGGKTINWQFFSVMDKYLCKKPEVNPPAVCSSLSGLRVNTPTLEQSITNNSDINYSTPTTSNINTPDAPIEDSPQILPSFSLRKRKLPPSEEDVERRHQEKLQRQDRFLDLFEQYIKKN